MMNSKVENYDPQKLEKNIQNYWEKKDSTVQTSTETMERKSTMLSMLLIHLENFIWDTFEIIQMT